MNKWFQKLAALGLAAALLVGSGVSSAFAADMAVADTKAYRTDFYQAVNGDWISKAVIPSDESSTSEMGDINNLVEKRLMDDINAMRTGNKAIPDDIAGFRNFVRFYNLIMDFTAREEQGMAPMQPELARIESLESVAQLESMYSEWLLDNMALPFGYGVDVDFKQANKNTLYLSLASCILPDVSYYGENKQVGDQLLAVFKDSITKMAVMAGKTQAEAATIAKETLEYDRLLVPFMPTSVEQSDLTNMYNPLSYQAVASSNKNLAEASKKLIGTTPSQIVVLQKKCLEGIAVAMDPQNFQKMKSWMYANTLMGYSNILTESYRQIAGQYAMAASGTSELTEKEKAASQSAIDRYSEPVGIYYGRTYLGEQGKADVTKMTKEFIATYRKRLESNTWMSDATRSKAIEKLDRMKIQMGYPDRVKPIYEQMTIVDKKQGGTLVSNINTLGRLQTKDSFSKYKSPADRTSFSMPGYMVNASYNPMSNTICFPAAFLQGAMYDTKQSASANYGGIGVVIAHEISHAFDPNGSKFDANGSMSNWWTQADYEKFAALSQGMIDQFDGVPHAGGTVNGELTVTENIADLGGLSCALSVAKSKADFDPQAFFKNYATIWRQKARPEMENMLLLTDPHSPAKLRVNMQLPNFEEFHEAYSVQPGDAMYRAPADRVAIW